MDGKGAGGRDNEADKVGHPTKTLVRLTTVVAGVVIRFDIMDLLREERLLSDQDEPSLRQSAYESDDTCHETQDLDQKLECESSSPLPIDARNDSHFRTIDLTFVVAEHSCSCRQQKSLYTGNPFLPFETFSGEPVTASPSRSVL